MPRVPVGNLVPGNLYIQVDKEMGYHLEPSAFIDINPRGYPTFNAGHGAIISSDPARYNYYNPGNANIPLGVRERGRHMEQMRFELAGADLRAALQAAPQVPQQAILAQQMRPEIAAAGLWPPTGIPILDNARDIGQVYDLTGEDPLENSIEANIIPARSKVYIISGPMVGSARRFRYTYLAENIIATFNAKMATPWFNGQLTVPDNNVEIGTPDMLRPDYLIERAVFMGTKNNDYGFSMRKLFSEGGRRRTKRSKRAKRSKKTRSNKI